MCKLCAAIKETLHKPILVAIEERRAELVELCMEANKATGSIEICRRHGEASEDEQAIADATAALMFGAYAIGYLISTSSKSEKVRSTARDLFRTGMAHGHVTRCCQEDANG